MKGIPYQRYRWIANTFPPASLNSGTLEESKFLSMCCDLVSAGVTTTIYEGPRGPIVVTWQRPALA